ncbi:adenylyl-sulfate kinase [Cupriavidus basilensis]|uniref:Adenylyl-sulfate kinase n=1 Tax=Cupriavidus basilensis TaxID=68895 RepID=A0ABT6B0D2_9BURK|nr:adenylyl-sulfate kinase [Cupriavidus basilensis]MDF3838063.1 adenylyl-sulfate kinase [Cupriavidus basilensis]
MTMTHRILAPHVSASPPHAPALDEQRPLTVWLTGLSGAGKSTLADGAQRSLSERGIRSLRIDGDQLRAGLCQDLRFSAEDRHENVRRAAQVARLLNDQEALVLVSMISPSGFDRQTAREIVGAGRFIEVYVRADLEQCRARDPKGLYARVERGEIAQFTGISAPYEPPQAPDLTIDTTTASEASCIDTLARLILGRCLGDDATQLPLATPAL